MFESYILTTRLSALLKNSQAIYINERVCISLLFIYKHRDVY